MAQTIYLNPVGEGKEQQTPYQQSDNQAQPQQVQPEQTPQTQQDGEPESGFSWENVSNHLGAGVDRLKGGIVGLAGGVIENEEGTTPLSEFAKTYQQAKADKANRVKSFAKEVTAGNFFSMNTPLAALETGAESAPGMALAAVPYVGVPALAASTTGNVYQEQAPEDKSLGLAGATGIGEAILERVGVGKIAKPLQKTAVGRIVESTLGEGVTEGAQQVVENIGTNASLEGATEGAWESAKMGALLGGHLRSGIELPKATINAVNNIRETRQENGADVEEAPEVTAQTEELLSGIDKNATLREAANKVLNDKNATPEDRQEAIDVHTKASQDDGVGIFAEMIKEARDSGATIDSSMADFEIKANPTEDEGGITLGTLYGINSNPLTTGAKLASNQGLQGFVNSVGGRMKTGNAVDAGNIEAGKKVLTNYQQQVDDVAGQLRDRNRQLQAQIDIGALSVDEQIAAKKQIQRNSKFISRMSNNVTMTKRAAKGELELRDAANNESQNLSKELLEAGIKVDGKPFDFYRTTTKMGQAIRLFTPASSLHDTLSLVTNSGLTRVLGGTMSQGAADVAGVTGRAAYAATNKGISNKIDAVHERLAPTESVTSPEDYSQMAEFEAGRNDELRAKTTSDLVEELSMKANNAGLSNDPAMKEFISSVAENFSDGGEVLTREAKAKAIKAYNNAASQIKRANVEGRKADREAIKAAKAKEDAAFGAKQWQHIDSVASTLGLSNSVLADIKTRYPSPERLSQARLSQLVRELQEAKKKADREQAQKDYASEKERQADEDRMKAEDEKVQAFERFLKQQNTLITLGEKFGLSDETIDNALEREYAGITTPISETQYRSLFKHLSTLGEKAGEASAKAKREQEAATKAAEKEAKRTGQMSELIDTLKEQHKEHLAAMNELKEQKLDVKEMVSKRGEDDVREFLGELSGMLEQGNDTAINHTLEFAQQAINEGKAVDEAKAVIKQLNTYKTLKQKIAERKARGNDVLVTNPMTGATMPGLIFEEDINKLKSVAGNATSNYMGALATNLRSYAHGDSSNIARWANEAAYQKAKAAQESGKSPLGQATREVSGETTIEEAPSQATPLSEDEAVEGVDDYVPESTPEAVEEEEVQSPSEEANVAPEADEAVSEAIDEPTNPIHDKAVEAGKKLSDDESLSDDEAIQALFENTDGEITEEVLDGIVGEPKAKAKPKGEEPSKTKFTGEDPDDAESRGMKFAVVDDDGNIYDYARTEKGADRKAKAIGIGASVIGIGFAGGASASEGEEPKGEYATVAKRLGKRESSNNYKAVNRFGYTGKYQFGAQALKDLGYVKKKPTGVNQKAWLANPKAWTGKDGITSQKAFLNSGNTQEKAFGEWAGLLDKRAASNKLYKYVGHTIDGVKITKAGIIQASHLLGTGAVRRALRSGNIAGEDANGTTMGEYLTLA